MYVGWGRGKEEEAGSTRARCKGSTNKGTGKGEGTMGKGAGQARELITRTPTTRSKASTHPSSQTQPPNTHPPAWEGGRSWGLGEVSKGR